MKRYSLYFTSDKRDSKQYANRVKNDFAADNPRDFFYTDQAHDFPLAQENRVYLPG